MAYTRIVTKMVPGYILKVELKGPTGTEGIKEKSSGSAKLFIPSDLGGEYHIY